MKNLFTILLVALLAFSSAAEVCTVTLSGDWSGSSLRIKEPTTGIDTTISATCDVWFRGTGNATFIYSGANGTNTFEYLNCATFSFTSPILTDGDVYISAGVLPVELVYFKYDNEFLKWETATEENNKGFEIQRSINGYDFETIDFVEGAGTSVFNQAYSYKVEVTETAYYRLKQVDYDGQFDYSEIVVVDGLGIGFSLTSTVVTDELFVNGSGMATVTNSYGQRVRQVKLNEFTSIDVSNLSNGIYNISNNNKTIRFLKIR